MSTLACGSPLSRTGITWTSGAGRSRWMSRSAGSISAENSWWYWLFRSRPSRAKRTRALGQGHQHRLVVGPPDPAAGRVGGPVLAEVAVEAAREDQGAAGGVVDPGAVAADGVVVQQVRPAARPGALPVELVQGEELLRRRCRRGKVDAQGGVHEEAVEALRRGGQAEGGQQDMIPTVRDARMVTSSWRGDGRTQKNPGATNIRPGGVVQ